MKETNILPCPCCESPAKLFGSSAFGYQIRCQTCKMMTDFFSINDYQEMLQEQGKDSAASKINMQTCTEWCKAKALETWNTRPTKGQH